MMNKRVPTFKECEEAYDKGGATAVEELFPDDWVWEWCEPCEADSPSLVFGMGTECAVCGSDRGGTG